MIYRREIDGLRAAAVVPVILFHAGFSLFTGGFIGVDVFFVISGFLITSIILEEMRKGTFSLVAFYERRARRLLPALFLVILCCLPFAWLWVMPEEFRDFSDSLIATSLSGANFLFWFKSGYFAPEAGEVPLLHIWSLAVEEQYYMFFPLLVIFMWKRKPNWLLATLVAIAFASLAYSEWASRVFPSANFYFLPSRAWEFLAGSICSFIESKGKKRGSDPLSLLGFGMIAFSVFYFDETSPIPSTLAVVPVVGAMLVLLFARQGTWVAALLSTRAFITVGKISYSAYLWHQPIFAFARIRSIDPPPITEMGALACFSLVLGYLSWRFVEQPFRRSQHRLLPSRRGLTLSASAMLAAFIAFGLYGHDTRGIPWRLPEPIKDFIADSEWSKTCLVESGSGWDGMPIKNCIFNGSHAQIYAILGDSLASALTPALARRLDGMNIGLEQITHSFCAPVADVSMVPLQARECGAFNTAAIDYLVKSKVKTVVLAASWKIFFEQSRYVFKGEEVAKSDARQRLREAFDKTVAELTAAGIRVVIVYPHPRGDTEIAAKVAKLMHKGMPAPTITIPQDEFLQQSLPSYAYLDDPKDKHVLRVDPAKIFCGIEAGRCDLARGGKALIFDKVHFTPTGADAVADEILVALKRDDMTAGNGVAALSSDQF
ncbi:MULTISPECIES: acyltransferase family protein [Rhizobium]|uniref:acyltransferase family protein n=1 Tax=Rhizobium TaxID=379 RepID=UPI00235E3944|nr:MULTISPECIES: acyltransferase family protein [unclassified Rhizobium]MDC9809538.1 acyltransferase family protein [Rhizobium sp. MC62]MDC9833149.1 acyltransferase family protein [Rhizobium sp. MJ37]WEA26956.1 acyltransferase family protein [Rhizobium sp. MJ22]WEA61431.1 acyltransferase family protein [Rhizobium sp. BJ04]